MIQETRSLTLSTLMSQLKTNNKAYVLFMCVCLPLVYEEFLSSGFIKLKI